MGKLRVSGTFYVTMAAKDGEKGEPGSDGKGISQEVRYYQRSSSNSTAPTSWATTPPALTSTYRYLWSYIKTTYTDGSTNSTTPAIIGVYGDRGSKGDKGARMIMLYWSECAEGFPFYSGKDGEEYYHVVFESRSDTLRTSTCYLCISSYTKSSSSALPSKDTTHWLAFENVALIATDLMLARKITAEEIDVDSLTVRNVSAVSNDGKTTCTIDGDTGKLTANNAEFDGVNAVNANVEGELCVKTLRRTLLTSHDNILNGSISVFQGSEYTLPYLSPGECVEVKVLSTCVTRVFNPCMLFCGSFDVRLYVGTSILDAKYARATITVEFDLIGFRYNGVDGLDSGITYWRIIPIGTTDTSGIDIEELPIT